MLMYKTKLDNKEKRTKEIKKGQKDVWTLKKGVVKNTISFQYNLNNYS